MSIKIRGDKTVLKSLKGISIADISSIIDAADEENDRINLRDKKIKILASAKKTGKKTRIPVKRKSPAVSEKNNIQEEPVEKKSTAKPIVSVPGKKEFNPFGTALYLARQHKGREISEELAKAVSAVPRESQMNLIWVLAPEVIRGEKEADGLFAIGRLLKRGQYPAMAIALRNALRDCPEIDIQTLMSLGVAEIRGEKGKERVSYSLSIPVLRKFAEYLRDEGKDVPASNLMAAVRKTEEFLAIRLANRAANPQPPETPTSTTP